MKKIPLINKILSLFALSLLLISSISFSVQANPYGTDILIPPDGLVPDIYGSHELRLVTNDSAGHSVDANENGIIDYAENLANVPPGQSVITGVGTANFITQFTSSKSIGNSIIYSDGTHITIGSVSPMITFSIASPNSILILDGKDYSAVDFYDNGAPKWGIGKFPSSGGNYFYIDESGFDSRLVILTGGNIGIGTKTPSEKLEVNGDVIITGVANCDEPNGKLYTDSDGKIQCGTDKGGSGGPGDINGAGTANYIPVFKAQKNIGDSNIYMDGTKVGINTITPQTELDVNGDLSIFGVKNCDSVTGKLYTDATGRVHCGTDQTVGGPAVGDNMGNEKADRNLQMLGYYISNDGSENGIYVASDGRVAIGTKSIPLATNFEVKGVTSSIVTIDSGAANQLSSIDFYNNGANKWGIGKTTGNNFYVDEFGQGNRLTILQGGNVGIGTSSPTQKLDVSGYIKSTNIYPAEVSACTNAVNSKLIVDAAGKLVCAADQAGSGGYWTLNGVNIYNSNSGNVGIGTIAPIPHAGGKALVVSGVTGIGDGRGIIEVWASGSNQKGILQQVGSKTYVGNLGSANSAWIAGNDVNFVAGGGAIAATILGANGYVGIGTTTPSQKLDVNGNMRINQQIYSPAGYVGFLTDAGGALPVKVGSLAITSAYVNNAPTNGLYVEGNAGIGTTTPGFKLDVVGRSRIQSGGGSAGIWYTNAANANRAFIGMIDDNYAGIYGTGPTQWGFAMNLDNGKVGIGTTSPTSALTVNGWIEDQGTDFKLGTSNAAGRGAGGRALVQDSGNTLAVNFNGDFGGGVRIDEPSGPGAGVLEVGDLKLGRGTAAPYEFIRYVGNDGTLVGGIMRNINDGYYGNGDADEDLTLYTYGTRDIVLSSTSQIILKPTTNVGIGVLAPTQKLDVNGYVKGTGLCIGNDCRTAWPAVLTCTTQAATTFQTINEDGTAGPTRNVGDWGGGIFALKWIKYSYQYITCPAGYSVVSANPICGDGNAYPESTYTSDTTATVGCRAIAHDNYHVWGLQARCCKVA